MPTLSEATSKFTVSEELTTRPSDTEKMLRWIQSNPRACKNTTFKRIAEQSLIVGMDTKQKQNCLARLVRTQMISYTSRGHGNKSNKNIFINYMHRNIPKAVLDNAPEPDVEEAKKIITNANIRQEAKKLLEKEQAEQAEADEKILQASKIPETSVTVPLTPENLSNGFSLTLNINFTFGK